MAQLRARAAPGDLELRQANDLRIALPMTIICGITIVVKRVIAI